MRYSDALARVREGAPNYTRYVGKKYLYGDTIIEIIGIYNYDYLETTTNKSKVKICYDAENFLQDVKNGVYKPL